MKHIRRIHASVVSSFRAWLPIAIAITGVFIALYCGTQYIVRSAANEDQARVSSDIIRYLSRGGDPMSLDAYPPVDLETTMSTFVIFYTLDFMPMTSTVLLDYERPVPPQRAFDYAKAHGEYRVTWEPKHRLKHAVIMHAVDGPTPGYLLVGKSLKETERTICGLWNMLSALWALTMLASLSAIALVRKQS